MDTIGTEGLDAVSAELAGFGYLELASREATAIAAMTGPPAGLAELTRDELAAFGAPDARLAFAIGAARGVAAGRAMGAAERPRRRPPWMARKKTRKTGDPEDEPVSTPPQMPEDEDRLLRWRTLQIATTLSRDLPYALYEAGPQRLDDNPTAEEAAAFNQRFIRVETATVARILRIAAQCEGYLRGGALLEESAMDGWAKSLADPEVAADEPAAG